MLARTRRLLAFAFCAAGATNILLVPCCYAAVQLQAAQEAGASRRIGVVKTINGSAIALALDSGSDVNITVLPATRIVRVAPGEKDLKNATPIQLQDIQVGDRILVGGKSSDDNLSLVASSVVVMKRSDLQSRDQQML